MMRLIRNVSLASRSSFKTVNIVFDEYIKLISTQLNDINDISEEFDFSGCIAIPGAIDLHTHLLTGTDKDAEILKKATRLAVKGGYTTLADMSFKHEKPLTKNEQIPIYKGVINNNSYCDIALWGFVDNSTFPYHIDQMSQLWNAGVVGLVIMNPSPNKHLESLTYNDMMDLFDKIYDNDISFAYQGYDTEENSQITMPEKRQAAIRKILRRLQDNPVHFVNITDKTTIEMLNIAFKRSDLTYSVNFADLISIVLRYHTLKGKDYLYREYFKLICDSMKNSKINSLSTEAGLQSFTGKMTEDNIFGSQSFEWLQWSLPLLFTYFWKTKYTSIQSCIRLTSENPAKRLGLYPLKGALLKGSYADITILDPHTNIKTSIKDAEGKPIEASCSIKAVFLRGNLLDMESSKEKPQGIFIKRHGSTRRRTGSTHWT